jgi:hypothetical protein
MKESRAMIALHKVEYFTVEEEWRLINMLIAAEKSKYFDSLEDKQDYQNSLSDELSEYKKIQKFIEKEREEIRLKSTVSPYPSEDLSMEGVMI